jgi:hypothetical protein
MERQKQEVVNEVAYFRVKLEITGDRESNKLGSKQLEIKLYEPLVNA